MSRSAPDESFVGFSSGSTYQVSDSSLVRRGVDVDGSDGSYYVETTDTFASQNVPITDLNLEQIHQDCRLLLQPTAHFDLMPTSDTPTDSVKESTVQSRSHNGMAKCLIVRHGPSNNGLQLASPYRLDFFFDTLSDYIELRNRTSNTWFDLRSLSQDPEANSEHLEPLGHIRLEPGFWAVCVFGPGVVFQLATYPRTHQVRVVQQGSPLRGRIEVPGASGTKRTFSARIQQQSATSSNPAPPNWEVVKPINSLIDANRAETVRVTSNDGTDYTIFRMADAGHSGSADVFTAHVSQHRGQVLVVKVFKPTPSAETRALNWAREYRIHERLKSDTIVQLHGADARIDALFLAHINAQDLARSTWLRDGYFCGTDADAGRVLLDMARALAYLRTESVLHNDIKPRNILYSRDTGATLIDFGLGTSDGEPASQGGTPWYIAPEYSAERLRQAPADVWALGVVMLYLLKRMPLPDLGTEVAMWYIKDVNKAGNSAQRRMLSWLGRIDQARQGLAEHTEGISRIVWQMLETDVKRRAGAQDLVEQMQLLQVSSA
ncbi:eukaryotic-like serine/threonine-protein kinase [Microdochium nivale]|nr:eukaryotic-like serine/threonine-protein kinase [Microdochium nivale]